VKFLRHFTAVVLVVAVIVGLGMLWAHTSGGGTGHAEHAPPREVILRVQQIKAGVIRVQSGDGFSLANTSDLIRTCLIEAVLVALVITVSAAWRRRRRIRRTAVCGSG